MADSKKDELVRFLEERAFKSVLNAKPKGRSEAEQKKLEHVQKATRTEIERFHKYRSAQDVVTNFRRDLDSESAKRVHGKLRSLGLPTINDIREEFERRAEELGVTG
jgi:predicted amidohydrolase YtcJ